MYTIFLLASSLSVRPLSSSHCCICIPFCCQVFPQFLFHLHRLMDIWVVPVWNHSSQIQLTSPYVQVFPWDIASISLDKYLRMEWIGYMVIVYSLRKCQTPSKMIVPFTFLSVEQKSCCTFSTTFDVVGRNFRHFNMCVVSISLEF